MTANSADPTPLTVVDLKAAARQAQAGQPPTAVAAFDDYRLSVVRVDEDLGLHRHDDADEPLIVLEGAIEVEVAGATIRLGSGQLCVVPRGQAQHPRPVGEAVLLLCERLGATPSVKLEAPSS
jgi:mannose-6-phosphate isomerase-like protein (cupin superfamily)